VKWRRYASGLHQALGLKVVDDKVYVLGRDQITRLHD
jgi:glucose/arabinose dehydrogenase